MSVSNRVLVIVATSIVALGGGRAWAQQVRPSATGPGGVALLYDDQKVSDEDRARLYTIVAASVPKERWQEVKVTTPARPERLVDVYYDYFSAGAYKAPLTVGALVNAIRSANNISGDVVPAGFMLKLPPLPARAFGRFDFGRAVRVFDAFIHGYSTRQNGAAVTLPATTNVAAVDAPAMQPARRATATMIVVPESSAVAAHLTSDLPRTVTALSALKSEGDPTGETAVIGMIPVEMLQTPSPPAGVACPPVRGLLDRSPFRVAQQARVQRLFSARAAELRAAASASPLTLLDVAFLSANGHGSKVQRVAQETLADLGASDLRTAIHVVELYPVDGAARSNLDETLTLYVKSGQAPLEAVPGEFTARVAAARAWLTNAQAALAIDPKPRVDIPEVLLRAVFWRYVKPGAWLNMSFRMRAPAMAGVIEQFAGGFAFASSAVLNRAEPLTTGYLPQDVTMARPTFVNVTYGTEQGDVLGQFSDGHDGARVPLLAPGCGFSGISEQGSSLASPHVAAASWLRALLDRVEFNRDVDPIAFTQQLVSATRPLLLAHYTESGGMFDPAMLIAFPDAVHYLVRQDGTVEPLTSLRLTMTCRMPAGVVTFTGAPTGLQHTSESFAVRQGPLGPALWRRSIQLDAYSRTNTRTECLLDDFELSAITVSGQPIAYGAGTVTNFARQVVMVTW